MTPSIHPAAPRNALAANTPTGTQGPTGTGAAAHARSDAGARALRLRHMHLVEGVPKKEVARQLKLDVKTVRRAIRRATPPVRRSQPRRARADLEALVETSPVGVAVFDAESGRPVSFNREARRIVESLRMPDRPPEQLLEVISCRRADGREVSLSGFPLARQLGSGETVRAEEMVLSVPDGRSVRTLVNATPRRVVFLPPAAGVPSPPVPRRSARLAVPEAGFRHAVSGALATLQRTIYG